MLLTQKVSSKTSIKRAFKQSLKMSKIHPCGNDLKNYSIDMIDISNMINFRFREGVNMSNYFQVCKEFYDDGQVPS